MPLEIFFCESENESLSKAAESVLQKYGTVKILPLDSLLTFSSCPENKQYLFFLPLKLQDKKLLEHFRHIEKNTPVFWFNNLQQLENAETIETIFQAQNPLRNSGIRFFLEKNSSIYSESFFSAKGIGQKLDIFFAFARTKLQPLQALSAWSNLNHSLSLLFQEIPGLGDTGTGERIDLQVGADEKKFCIYLKYNGNPDNPEQFTEAYLLAQSAHYAEYKKFSQIGKKEITLIYLISNHTNSTIQNIIISEAITSPEVLEKMEEVQAYSFKDLQGLEKNLKEGERGFKKKFSERVAATTIAAEKNPSQLQSKIVDLEEILKQKELLITKLNKEIQEINDPLKRDIISNIKDNQTEGLKNNISRLEEELEVSRSKEKEWMLSVDKALIMKDEAVKKMKEAENKLRQKQEGINFQITQLEKQLEQATKLNKDLMKKITELTEKLEEKKVA